MISRAIKDDTDFENAKKQNILDLMKDMPLQTLQIAYLYAKNYAEYGADVTKTWIMCSERLPEDRDWYLGIFKEPDTGWINPLPFICDYVGSKTKATTKEHWILRGFTDRDECIDYYFNLECVAWQPLPEPYKGETDKIKEIGEAFIKGFEEGLNSMHPEKESEE